MRQGLTLTLSCSECGWEILKTTLDSTKEIEKVVACKQATCKAFGKPVGICALVAFLCPLCESLGQGCGFSIESSHFICTKPKGHEGPHVACGATASSHPTAVFNEVTVAWEPPTDRGGHNGS